MAPPRLSLIIQSPVAPSSYVQAAKLERKPASSHSHISSFRSLLLDMQIYSSSVKPVKHPRLQTSHSYPVFGDQDKIEGKVMLDPSCSKTGRLTVSLEGAFEYSSVLPDDGRKPTMKRHRHVFLSSSTVAPISSPSESRSTIRGAFSVRKRPSLSSLNSPAFRSCEFSFDLPRGSRFREEMPSTLSNKMPVGNQRGQSPMEEFEVAYRIAAVWEPSDGSENCAMLEAPVLLQADTDFQSIDGSAAMAEPGSWLEMPLMPDRPIPFICAVTLPHILSFSRCDSFPYFVVFSTNTRSQSLIKEIAADATIAVSLIRKITITPQHTTQSPITPDSPLVSDESDGQGSVFTSRSKLKRSLKKLTRSQESIRANKPITPPPGSDESDGQGPAFTSRSELLRRSFKTLTRSQESIRANKPLPELPQQAFSSSRTLQTQVSIGFPKRPRTNDAPQNLPDGLYKGKMQLSKDMLPSVDWRGISVKYYLDVSVLVGQDDVRAHIPIWIY